MRITEEMRTKLRVPLPAESVSPHPTKSYLSSIKAIYVAERINNVFGIGSWTLKSEVIERIEKFVVVKAILEILEYGFYGEAYGGNDNADIGDAYKGATTDGFTKIAGQQLEIGMDVFKGLSTGKKVDSNQPPKPAPTKPEPTPTNSTPDKEEEYPHLNNVGELFNRAKSYGISPRDVMDGVAESTGQAVTKPEDIKDFDTAWALTFVKFTKTIKAARAAQ